VYAPDADYPRTAAQDRVAGEVFMDVVVNPAGQVRSVTVTKSVRADIDESAVRKVKTWRFEPAYRDSKAVTALITVSMAFNAK
jgi:protein TonB